MITTIFAVFATLTTFASQSYVARVVDAPNPSHPDEFADIESAATAVCEHQGGKILVEKTNSALLGHLNLNCDIELVAASRAQLRAAAVGEATTITSTGSFVLAGFSLTNEAGVEVRANGPLEIRNNSFVSVLKLAVGNRTDILNNDIAALEVRSAVTGGESALTISETTVGRLKLAMTGTETPDGLHVNLTRSKVGGEFFWDTKGMLDLSLDDFDVGPNANITNTGSIDARFRGAKWRAGVTINSIAGARAGSESVKVTSEGGLSGGHVEILGNAAASLEANIEGLQLAPGAHLSIDRRDRAKGAVTRPDGPGVSVRGIQFSKPGGYLKVAGASGPVTIENNTFNLDYSELQAAGLRLADLGENAVRVAGNEFLISAQCNEHCTGIRGQRLRRMAIETNRFFVYGKYAHGMDLTSVSGEISGNRLNGGGQYGGLVQVSSMTDWPSVVAIKSNAIDANGFVAVQLKGPTFANLVQNQFTGSGIVSDEAGLDMNAVGGLLEDPLLNNTGLHDKNVNTLIDFDGNGCRDIPREFNEKNPDGSCKAVGKPRPNPPRY